MLIPYNNLIEKYGLPKGIIHIGAHLMEEREDYLKSNIKNIIWMDANPYLLSEINKNIKLLDTELFYNYIISDINDKEYDFKLTNNTQSSSILELKEHSKYYPDIYVTETLKIFSKRVDCLFKEENLNINSYDFINLDIQGAELLALKGFGDLLNNIKYIYTEINTNFLYENCALIEDIDSFLKQFNFERAETVITGEEWGDAFYVKR